MTDRQVYTKRSQTDITNTSSQSIVKHYNKKNTNDFNLRRVGNKEMQKMPVSPSPYARRSVGVHEKSSKITGRIYVKLDIRKLHKTVPTHSNFC